MAKFVCQLIDSITGSLLRQVKCSSFQVLGLDNIDGIRAYSYTPNFTY